MKAGFRGLVWLSLLCLTLPLAAADPSSCAVCGAPLIGQTFILTDEVTQQKTHVCTKCDLELPNCFICSLPALTNAPGFVSLPDGRALCARDAKTAVLDSKEGVRICHEVQEQMGRLFSRFLALPETNVTVAVVDRVNLQELFKFAGNDYSCPNVWGYTHTETNQGRLQHQVNVLSGLPLSWFRATCAHEFGHVWVAENVPAARREALNRSAEEGFCELASYLFIDSLRDEPEKAHILRNNYTRGQIRLFIAADRQYGLNDVLEWMRYGTDSQLSAEEPGRVRNVEMPRRSAAPGTPAAAIPGYRPAATPAPTNLVLQAVFWDERRPSAVINHRAFGPNEEGRVRVGTNSVSLRCLEVLKDRVRIRVLGSEQEQELLLKAK